MSHRIAMACLPLVLAAVAWAQAPTDGEVRRIDKATGKITLKHGEIKHLDLPPMQMVFQVQDPGLLDRVKVGDKVVFTAVKHGGAYTVTTIQPR